MASLYYKFSDELCPFLFCTCNKEMQQCPVLPADDWQAYAKNIKAAQYCKCAGVELTPKEYATRYVRDGLPKIDRLKLVEGDSKYI